MNGLLFTVCPIYRDRATSRIHASALSCRFLQSPEYVVRHSYRVLYASRGTSEVSADAVLVTQRHVPVSDHVRRPSVRNHGTLSCTSLIASKLRVPVGGRRQVQEAYQTSGSRIRRRLDELGPKHPGRRKRLPK